MSYYEQPNKEKERRTKVTFEHPRRGRLEHPVPPKTNPPKRTHRRLEYKTVQTAK